MSRLGKAPILYMMGGLPGAGKTCFARYAAAKADAIHLNSVQMREALYLNSDSVPRDLADPLVFGAMDGIALAILGANQSVFYDASHNLASVRNHSRALAARAGAVAILLWVDTPLDVAAERVSTRPPDSSTKRLPPEVVYSYTVELPNPNEMSIIIDGQQPLAKQFEFFQEQLYR